MKIKTRFFEITIMTKRGIVKRDIQEHGRMRAIKLYLDRHKCGLGEAFAYIKSVEREASQ